MIFMLTMVNKDDDQICNTKQQLSSNSKATLWFDFTAALASASLSASGSACVERLTVKLIVALSSPRRPESLRAESARAVTGRRCPHSGEGEDFLTGQLNFFTKTAVTPERKVEKSIPRWEINRHAEG